MSRISELNNLTTLNLSHNQISNIKGLENMINLTNLSLGYNTITKIEGLENLVNLKQLDLIYNNIIDITPLSKNISLTTLDLRGNSQIDGNRSNYTGERLEKLSKIGEILDRGGTINLDIDKLGLFTNYKKLNLTGQNLTTLEQLDGLTELQELNLYNNKLTLEDEESQEILSSMTKLQTLNLFNNKVTDITAINNLKNLKTLNLEGTNNNVNLVEIEDIISNLTNLTISPETLNTIINCDVNKIKSLIFGIGNHSAQLPNLSIFNKMTKISIINSSGITNFEEVSKIANLNELTLKNCNLHGRMIDFSQLTNLTNLDLSGNTLWSEDLENLKVL